MVIQNQEKKKGQFFGQWAVGSEQWAEKQGIDMTKAIRIHSGLNLAPAKQLTDSVLTGNTVVIEVEASQAQSFIISLTQLGAITELITERPMP